MLLPSSLYRTVHPYGWQRVGASLYQRPQRRLPAKYKKSNGWRVLSFSPSLLPVTALHPTVLSVYCALRVIATRGIVWLTCRCFVVGSAALYYCVLAV